MERERRFELPTLALARRCSTTELFPLDSRATYTHRHALGKQSIYQWVQRAIVKLRQCIDAMKAIVTLKMEAGVGIEPAYTELQSAA